MLTTRQVGAQLLPDTSLTSPGTFTAAQMASVYGVPAPDPSQTVVVGVISFGGGLYGTLSKTGVLTNSDCQKYWTAIGIPAASQPTVVVVPVAGGVATANDRDGGATLENSLDVQTIGAVCPSPKLTIVLYVAPNSIALLPTLLQFAFNTPLTATGGVLPSVVSCSWGAPEAALGSETTAVDAILSAAAARGVNFVAATGDGGSSDGVGATTSAHADFPSSSPHVVAVGGTSLVCPHLVYDSSTVETAWSSGGGAVSTVFAKPAYQSALSVSGRSTPDVASNADPNTGVVYIVNGRVYTVGGTSVAAPTFAGFLAAVRPTSFVNTALYAAQTQGCFHDITTGSNGDWTARAGYDNCTGIGSIIGGALSAKIAATVVPGTALTVTPSTVSVVKGQSASVTVVVTPANATHKVVSWSSASPTIATVTSDNTGKLLVDGLAVGTAVITASTVDGITATLRVTVTPVVVTSLSLNVGVVNIRVGQSTTLTATLHPAGAALVTPLAWSSTLPTVASVNSNGIVTALKAGSTIISLTSGSIFTEAIVGVHN